MIEARTHLLIPDCQVQPGPEYRTEHLEWIGRYWLDHRAEIDAAICIGDFADMSSLSSYDRGRRSAEGRRIVQDFEATRDAMATLLAPIAKHNAKMRKQHEPLYRPEMHLTLGNHEHRIDKATEDRADLEGVISTKDLGYEDAGWTVHPFLDVLHLDGLAYSHYFYNTGNGRAISGNIETRLRAIGASFVQGHQQQLAWGMRYVMGRPQMGLVAGACYLGRSPAEYRGPQAEEWRGIVMLRNVADGFCDIETISLSTLCERYEGTTLARFMARRY